MRAVLQRVARASVSVDGQVVSAIGKGICVLVGIGVDDNESDIDYMVRKLLSLRVFDEGGVMWKKSVQDMDYELLCVSQFTLFAKTTKGSKPDFHSSMKTSEANEMYQKFLLKLGQAYSPEKIKGFELEKLKDGVFGAMMMVDILNEGPVTIELDSRKFTYEAQK
ncbi:D-tyrosyl-tRNA(Tyr) deacylase [Umbelopsis nana]